MKNRIYYLDYIKVFLTMLVIAHHVSITYGGAGGWYLTDHDHNGTASLILTLFNAVNQAYFMSFFFFISAFFVPGSFDRKGPAVFLRDRFIRLGIPLVLFYLVLSPLLVYLVKLYYGTVQSSFFSFWIGNLNKTAGAGPMWFVQALLLFSVFYTVVRLVQKDRSRSVYFPSSKKILIFLLVAAAAAFAIRIVYPIDKDIIGFKIGYFPLYILLFICGILAKRNNWLKDLDSKKARPWFITAIVFIALLPLAAILLGDSASFNGGFSIHSLVYSIWEPFVCAGIIIQLLVIFRRYTDRSVRIGLELSRSAYAVYIFHPFFCIGAAMLLVPLAYSVMLKFVLCSLLSVISTFIFAGALVRIPVIRRII